MGSRSYNQERVDILYFLVKRKWENLLPADPLKVFVKQEPVKLAKFVEGRWRLISAVSLVDTMIDRILFGPMWRRAQRVVLGTPCAVGWNPLHGGWKDLVRIFPHGTLSIDRSAWDWTVQGWMITAWEQFIFEMHPGAPLWWKERVSYRFGHLFDYAKFQFADGTRVLQPVAGIMKSGCYLTLCLNSVGQSLIHYIVMNRLGKNPFHNQPLTFGDDTVMAPFEGQSDYVRCLGELCIVKEPEIAPYVNFVGFAMNLGGFCPAYWKKHLYKLSIVDVKVQEETLESYQYLYAYEPSMLGFIREMLSRINPEKILSDRQLLSVVG